MEQTLLAQFNDLGVAAALCFSAIGSAMGTGIAGMASIGAWKKCYAQNKPAPALLTVFSAFPLSQTLYGFILMNKLATAAAKGQYFWAIGILGGLAMGASALMQGKAAAAASDTYAEFGQGQGNYIIVLGIIETVAILVFVFLQGKVGLLTG